MKTKHILIGTIALIVAGGLYSFKIVSSAWNINSKDAKISFDMPNGKHTGTFSGLNASFEFDPANPGKAVLVASIDVNSVITDDGTSPKLAEHLKTADFFDAANHPTITFKADSVIGNDTGFVAMGQLSMRDSTHNISVPFKFLQDGKKAIFKGKMELFAGDYGIGKKSEKGNDKVVVDIEVPVSQE